MPETPRRCNDHAVDLAMADSERSRVRPGICYCDPELYRVDPAGCQMVCRRQVKSSAQFADCECFDTPTTCRKWLCRLGDHDRISLYCRTPDSTLVPCHYAGQSNLTDFGVCNCRNNGWLNAEGLCECQSNFYGPTCEIASDFAAKNDKWHAFKGDFSAERYLKQAQRRIRPDQLIEQSEFVRSDWERTTAWTSIWNEEPLPVPSAYEQRPKTWGQKNGLTLGICITVFILILCGLCCFGWHLDRRKRNAQRNNRNDQIHYAQARPILEPRREVQRPVTGVPVFKKITKDWRGRDDEASSSRYLQPTAPHEEPPNEEFDKPPSYDQILEMRKQLGKESAEHSKQLQRDSETDPS